MATTTMVWFDIQMFNEKVNACFSFAKSKNNVKNQSNAVHLSNNFPQDNIIQKIIVKR